jgi:hypothetical protein
MLNHQAVPKRTKNAASNGPATVDITSSGDAKIEKVKPRRASTKKGGPTKKTSRKAKSAAAVGTMVKPTDEEIRTRAYFISERRRRFGLPGDANSDWIEAKRQLLSDSGPR